MKSANLPVAGLILAAGKGTRMKSTLPKVLHQVEGKPILERAIFALKQAGIGDICTVIGADIAPFEGFLSRFSELTVCIQKKQLGTADAVGSAAPALANAAPPPYTECELYQGEPFDTPNILICYGDNPSLKPHILHDFVTKCLEVDAKLGVIGMQHPEPTGYGRLITDTESNLLRIVEEKDADAATKRITTCNTGITFAQTSFLFEILGAIRPNNAQKEYYLTDCFEIALKRDQKTFVYLTDDYRSFDGVNTKEQLEMAQQWERQKSPS